MYVQKQIVTATTNGSGAATVYSGRITGRILSIRYRKTDFADGVDFTITLEGTGEGLWTESDVNSAKQVYPRVGVHDLVGVARTFDGTRTVPGDVVAFDDRVKIVIASGGSAKTGAFDILVG